MNNIRTNHFGVDLSELQIQARLWAEYNFPQTDEIQQMLGVVEEVGELAHFMLKEKQGIREAIDSNGAKVSTEAHQMDAVGDITIFLINLCVKRGWSFDRILADTWAEVSQRDFIKFPKNGRTA
jgi:NTP pyrophosphatase (non-canonical NTP hydrolase)